MFPPPVLELKVKDPKIDPFIEARLKKIPKDDGNNFSA